MNKILNKFRIKRKKGFTLIELLAVIIILSILIVLATSQVIKHVKTAKRKAFLTKANQVLKAANSAEVDDGAIVEKTYKFPDDRTLDLKWFPEAGYVMRDSYGKYKVSIWDDKLELCAYKGFEDDKIVLSETITTKTDCTKIPGEEHADESSLSNNQYQIVYHANFDGGAGDVTQVLTKGTTAYLQSNSFTRSNYKFIGWTTKFDGTGDIYSDEAQITEPTDKKTIHLYANWGSNGFCSNNTDVTIIGKSTCSNNNTLAVSGNTLCKRAISLHQEECKNTTDYCAAAGYTETGTKGTNMITFGNCGTIGTLSGGDAFTCDVNGDGVFDELKERFYYIGKYYNTSSKTYQDDTAVLIYSSFTSNGVSCNYDRVSYGQTKTTPNVLRSSMPTTSQWSNTSLVNEHRVILAQNGKVMNEDFSYEGYAARPVIIQELGSTFGIDLGNSTGGLEACDFIFENTKYSDSTARIHGTLYENPDNFYSGYVWTNRSQSRASDRTGNGEGATFGGRPVIEVPMSRIVY